MSPTIAMVPNRLPSIFPRYISAAWEVRKECTAKRFCVSQTVAPLWAKAFIICGLLHLGGTSDKSRAHRGVE